MKKYLHILIVFILLITTNIAILANSSKVVDDANLLTDGQLKNLEGNINKFIEKYSMDLVIHTTNDIQGKTMESYADDYFDYNDYGIGDNHDGVILVIDMGSRKFHISTCGVTIKYLTDARIDSIKSSITPHLSEGNYYDAFNTFISKVNNYVSKGIPSNSYLDFEGGRKLFTNEYNEPLSGKDYLIYAAISLVAALLVALITRLCIIYLYKHPHQSTPYITPNSGSVNYTDKQDRFISTRTSRTKIEKNSSNGGSSGRSSVHRSSSGRSHGGGGGGF